MIRDLKKDAKIALALSDGGAIVLLDMLGVDASVSWSDVNRNVYRVAPDGSVTWQIGTRSGPDERFPFTNIYFDEGGSVRAYCWDGGEYRVDFDTGDIDSGKLAK